jgi:hypothetical protein
VDGVTPMDLALQRLVDDRAIRDLANRYVHHLWREEPRQLAALFAEEGAIRHRGEGLRKDTVGRAAIEELLTESARSRKPRPMTHNHLIEFDSEDYATGSSFVVALDGMDSYSLLLVARYDDEYVKRDGGWLFLSRQPSIVKVKPALVDKLNQATSPEQEKAQ